MLGQWYQWFWFHTEWYLTPVNRRPYTFIFRDWIYNNTEAFTCITLIWFIGIVALSYQCGVAATIIGIASAALYAHLMWGSKWIEGQQEYPEYLGE